MKKFWLERMPFFYYLTKYKNTEHESDYRIVAEDFEVITGLKLKPGEIAQCELKVIKKG